MGFVKTANRLDPDGKIMAKIVLIDDEPLIRSVVADVLKHAGHAVALAADGKEGVALLRSCAADLVITDLVMPEMEGIELIRQLRREFPALKIVAISGAGDSDAYLKAARILGAHATLAKPFTAGGLLTVVNAVIEPR